MKFLRSKCGIIFMVLAVLLCIGVMHAADSVISAEILDYLKNSVKPTLIELLATSEFNTPDELKTRLIQTSVVMKSFAEKYGSQIGLTEEAPASAVTSVPVAAMPEVQPAITVSAPLAPPAGVASSPEIKVEAPAAAMTGAQDSNVEGVSETIQPPAILATPVVSAVSAPIAVVPEATELGDLAVPAAGQITGSEIAAPPALAPLGGTLVSPALGGPAPVPSIPAPIQEAVGSELPALGDLSVPLPAPSIAVPPVLPAPVAPALSVPTTVVPAPVSPVLPGSPVQNLAPLDSLAPLAPLAYQDLDDLDDDMSALMTMGMPSIAQSTESFDLPVQALDIVAAEQSVGNLEMLSVSSSDIPVVAADDSLDSLNLPELTLAGLE